MKAFKQYIAVAAAVLPVATMAQTTDTISSSIVRDVDVVNTYMPTISNPTKMQVAPMMDDTMSYKPSFNYTVLNKVHIVKTPPDSLDAAGMSFYASQSPYKALLKGYAGNANSGGMFFYNIGNSPRYHLSLEVGHDSWYGKLKQENDEKVQTSVNDTWAGVDFARFFKKTALTADMKFKNKLYEYYGLQTVVDSESYTNELGVNAQGSELTDDVKQRNTTFDMNLGYGNSLVSKRDVVSYMFNAGFGTFSNKTGVSQLDMRFKGSVRFPIKKNYLLDINVDVNNFKISVPDYEGKAFSFAERSHTDVQLNPHFGIDFDHVDLRVGLNFVVEIGDEADNFYMIPDMLLNLNIADDVVSLYGGITGMYRANSYREIVAMNPFVSPDACNFVWKSTDGTFVPRVYMPTTQNPIALVGGLTSRFSNIVSLDAGVDYRSFDDELFFVNRGYVRTNDKNKVDYSNLFGIISENGKVFTVKGELNITPTERFAMLVKARYYKWTLDYIEEAWYKPKYEMAVDARFYPLERLLVTVGANLRSETYGYNQTTKQKEKIDLLVDVNVGAEYKFSSRLSFFAQFNNVAAQDYKRWLGYSSYRFNANAGVTFKF
jgi:hypothetical protein